ncbi:flavodoxin family protein, partial [Achromobacter xylosoxidans]
MKRLLIVWHSRTGAARQMAEAAARGAAAAAAQLEQPDDLAV